MYMCAVNKITDISGLNLWWCNSSLVWYSSFCVYHQKCTLHCSLVLRSFVLDTSSVSVDHLVYFLSFYMISSYGRLWPNTNEINFKGMSVSDRSKKTPKLEPCAQFRFWLEWWTGVCITCGILLHKLIWKKHMPRTVLWYVLPKFQVWIWKKDI